MEREPDDESGLDNECSKRIKITLDMHSGSVSTPTPVSEQLPLSFLPFELNHDILLRLPVKSLSRFKCVSKSWLSFIANPQFVKGHLAAASDDDQCASHNIIFTLLPPTASLKVCSLPAALSETDTEVFDVDYPMKRPRKSVWVFGYCQGLVCYAIREKHLYLWNPTTGKTKKLPDSNHKLQYGCYVLYGFGFDEKNEDHKVVGIFCVFAGAGFYETEVKVYSLKNDSWRRTEDFKGGIPLDDSGKYASGKLHWAASCKFATPSTYPYAPPSGSSDDWKIICLDLVDETYGEISRPDYGENTNDWMFGAVNGCLSVLCNYQRTRADFWVMKEYGSKESWTRTISIPYLNLPHNTSYSMPLCILKNGEILLTLGIALVVYNPKQNSVRYLRFNNLNTFFEVAVFVQSLVSPYAYGTGPQHQEQDTENLLEGGPDEL